MQSQQCQCVYCQRSDEEVPLVALRVRGEQAWICPEHLPILIHKPHLLAGKLPGAENVASA
ncbi:MAG: hypothetical protein D6803_01310 [Anaerolineae bacterium]|nr:MAG: hypothetical protein D6803_01310 [Anaerolineae bacterium]